MYKLMYTKDDIENINMVSRIGWQWRDLVFSLSDIDPAYLFAIISGLTLGNKYYKKTYIGIFYEYLQSSSYWIDIFSKYPIQVEDVCSSYGLLSLPFLHAYSLGFKKFEFNLLYNLDISVPYVVKYIKKLYRTCDGDVKEMIYRHGIVTGKDRDLNIVLSLRKADHDLTYKLYTFWKKFLKLKGVWHETIV
ncbi:MAG: hypothetical protein J7L15_05685 [Clostridiales bacterium]|nr:hypothetical protein [Clostridiales bacterium]